MNQPSTVSCPKCGMQVSGDAAHCPLCQARIHPITSRRMGLWAAIAVLVLVVLVLWAMVRR
jgi:uncharacterized paraquat-inducible protein A